MLKKRKLLAVASAGGHWTQLNLMNEAFSEFDIHYVTTSLNHKVSQERNKISKVVDADRFNKFKMLILIFQMFGLLIWHRPHTVISTGAAPGFFAILFGRIIGAKTIWVDSMANYQKISGSGIKARPFCHVFLTQWSHLADENDTKTQYKGSVI